MDIYNPERDPRTNQVIIQVKGARLSGGSGSNLFTDLSNFQSSLRAGRTTFFFLTSKAFAKAIPRDITKQTQWMVAYSKLASMSINVEKFLVDVEKKCALDLHHLKQYVG
jgi:hypothetical protein